MDTNETRPFSLGMERQLQVEHKVLDHGFIRVVDYMGNDAAIVQAAQVSYGTGTKKNSSHRGLIRYLMNHWHTTPFEMCEVKFHVKLPVFVARQWIRHRTANVNEYSARYSILDREFYIPPDSQLQMQSKDNNQGRDGALDSRFTEIARSSLLEASDGSYDMYEALLNEGEGLTRELSRMVLPTNIYTQWYWKVDLHNLFHFLRLRADPHAQWEIRQYADVLLKLVADWVPLAHEAFVDYRLEAEQFSKQEMEMIRKMAQAFEEEYGSVDRINMPLLSDREYKAFKDKLDI